MKHRITRYLASEMGFTVFAIEANMPEAYRVNDYVLTGHGDPKALLDGMYFWTWNTHEVLDMIEWMRAFNAGGKGRIQFTGFDMQTPDTAAAIARRTLAKADPAGADSLDACLLRLSRDRFQRQPASFATATATLPVTDFAGRHVRYSGWIRTRDVAETGFAGLWMRADSAQERGTAFDNMQAQHVNGTRDWRRYAIELDIPRGSTNVNFGALLVGAGRAWVDSLAIEVDGKPWRGDGSVELTLESAGGYKFAMDDSVAHDGVRSLSMWRLNSPAEPVATPSGTLAEPVRRLLARVEGEREALARATTPAEADWAIQNLRVVEQSTRMRASENGSPVRDSSMARNVDWILAHEKPGTKLVLWAHNAHVSRKAGWMGSHLAARHGADMVVLGFAMHDGQYTAVEPDKGLKANDAEVPNGDAFEALCHATGSPRFLLDLRLARNDAAARRYFGSPELMRSIGALAMKMQFTPTDIAHDFDAIVFVDHTTPTRLMHPGK